MSSSRGVGIGSGMGYCIVGMGVIRMLRRRGIAESTKGRQFNVEPPKTSSQYLLPSTQQSADHKMGSHGLPTIRKLILDALSTTLVAVRIDASIIRLF